VTWIEESSFTLNAPMARMFTLVLKKIGRTDEPEHHEFAENKIAFTWVAGPDAERLYPGGNRSN
jgi:hypothetical protein